MKTKYAVLNDKLYPVDVAELLLNEGAGSSSDSVQVILNPEEDYSFSNLADLILQASQAEIIHSYTILNITEMLLKLIKNNESRAKEIVVKIVQGNKTFLHIYFKE